MCAARLLDSTTDDWSAPLCTDGSADVFVITLVNDGSMGHSIDFHAGSLEARLRPDAHD